MNDIFTPSFRLGDPGEVTSPTHERVAALRGSVYPDGGACSFTVQFTNQRAFKVLVPFVEMPAILHEFRMASEKMVTRQAQSIDGGASAVLELCRNAMRPRLIEGLIDRQTGDRIYLMQFDDHAPLAVRIAPTEALALRERMDRLTRALSN